MGPRVCVTPPMGPPSRDSTHRAPSQDSTHGAPSIVPWQRFTSEEQKKSEKTSEALADIVKQKVMEDPMEKMRGMIGMLKEVATIFPTAGNQAPALMQQPDTQQTSWV